MEPSPDPIHPDDAPPARHRPVWMRCRLGAADALTTVLIFGGGYLAAGGLLTGAVVHDLYPQSRYLPD
ncbi:hypothetical protein [Streptomyces yaizuensis]|uniref:Uncharacterized protein n=1 Tax=Streptomyces yaizuensis TaxID=2989713 RepID=A0ABQ5P467_9ACTN|nr:hypothetical protein [Streptomyces sp. YSPA8]GLF97312.1 hypothetical protein SYYSPA8_23465 [Streptomyces sp. YSPA8]